MDTKMNHDKDMKVCRDMMDMMKKCMDMGRGHMDMTQATWMKMAMYSMMSSMEGNMKTMEMCMEMCRKGEMAMSKDAMGRQ